MTVVSYFRRCVRDTCAAPCLVLQMHAVIPPTLAHDRFAEPDSASAMAPELLRSVA